MTRPLALALGALLFTLLATANSGGYRYGVSDQAFYQPAVALSLHPDLFPRDRVVLASQMRLWLGDSFLAWTSRLTGGDLPRLFVIVYAVSLVALFAAAVAFARSLGSDWWTVAAFLALLTLRHRIPKTGANSLEGYMHPRMLAFAIGLAAFAAIARGRFALAAIGVAGAALVHTTVALWFGGALFVAFAWQLGPRRATVVLVGGAALAALMATTLEPFAHRLQTMDPAWIAVLGEKDYLFPAEWPAYAWLLNLCYPAFLLWIYARRRRLGRTAPGETSLIAGLVALVLVFLISVPLTAWRIALAVQLQVNRVFWVLDAVVVLYLSWWLMADLAVRWSAHARRAVVIVILAVSAVRGAYLVGDRDWTLFEVGLPATSWTDAMLWLRSQPTALHVLADPFHAMLFGPSVRVAAERDTLLELGKDAALAMYDRDVALRLAERDRAVGDFSTLTLEDVRKLARTYSLDVLVDRTTRRFELPVLYKNDQFIVYDLH